MAATPDRQQLKLDQAARAAWLYYVAGDTQEQIADKLGISRPAAQRMIAFAVSERLVRVEVTRPIASCAALAETLTARFGLQICDVQPSDPTDPASMTQGVALAAALRLEAEIANPAPVVIGLTTGRALRAMVEQVTPASRPQHRLVSLVGSIGRDASANRFEVVMRLADRLGCRCYPRPMPLVAETEDERNLYAAQRAHLTLNDLAEKARLSLVGISDVSWDGPLHVDGFLTDEELNELSEQQAVGEIAGWAFDREGRLIDGSFNRRVLSAPLRPGPGRTVVAIGGGARKVQPIAAALRGRLISGLITDEDTAAAVVATL
ncbi:MAG: sugar-binding transcriptional regulator [Alphaproteobacteria bacterium]